VKIFSDQVMQRAERHALRFAKRFINDEDGATAIEFAFVALPFFALLFGIMELAIVFFINSALTHATSEAGRLIRVGNFQACGGADQFKALVCENMKGLGANAAGDTMVVRSVMHYRLVLPPLLTRLDSPKGSGARTMVATTAFRNEPFPVDGTCSPSTLTKIAAGTQ